MGKTRKPLNILVIGQIHPELAALAEQGHQVDPASGSSGYDLAQGLAGYDLILGPNCARYLPGMEKFLDSFVKGARMLKYGKERKSDSK